MRPPINTPHKSAVECDETRFWLALHRTPGIGARSCGKLLADYGSPSKIFHVTSEQLRAAGIRAESIDALSKPDWDSVDQDLAWLAEPGNRLLTCLDPGYPPLLKEIPDPPALLFVHGDPEHLQQPQLV